MGMWELRKRPPHRLSAGQKQRVAIAGALALKPRALVLDEATSMLDPAGRRTVVEVLRLLQAQGTTLVTITHEMEEAAEANRVVVLQRGQVMMDGDPHAIFARAAELRELGLDIPPLADLSLRLGLPVCLTVDELLAALGPAPAAMQTLLENTPCSPSPQPLTETITDPIVTVEGLQHAYLRGTPLESPALHGVDLQIPRGEITGLIGPTGSGKSTLMQHLNGLIRPQAGRVVVDGKNWADPELDVGAARQKVGLLFQQPEDQLFERYVGDDVAFGPRQLKLEAAEVRQRVRDAMDAVGLPFESFKDRLTQTLSGGEQRRAALAGLLAMQPRLLVVDEPTAGLDPHGRAEAQAIFRRINQAGVTVIFGSHRMEDVLALCKQVVALREGRVARTGPVREVLGRPDIDMPVLPLVLAASRLCEAGWPVPVTALTVPEIADVIIKAGFQVAAG
ncbi:MAG TPA: ATP-binding cassette domain-containing protein [Anaerolineales bacterium]|nr:ATP-binding cassette domain-containing protein [Anaerolineales bacterium]